MKTRTVKQVLCIQGEGRYYHEEGRRVKEDD
jgi:hypothetical protein